MRVDVSMPQMGESIAEGTITRWMKKVGETVQRDEPLFEISTDKVDAEIPSPAAGTLVEIRSQQGETIPVNQVVAVLETEAGAAASAGTGPAAAPPAPPEKAPVPDEPITPGAPPSPTPYERRPEAQPAPEARIASPGGERQGAEGSGSGFVSPVVRRIAAEHGIDPAQLRGTGAGGRVTKKDILQAVEQRGAATEQAAPAAAPRPQAVPAPLPFPSPAPPASPPSPAGLPPAVRPSQPDAPSFPPGERTVRVPMTAMRRKISEHMVESRRVSAHVHSVFEVDLTQLLRVRDGARSMYEQHHGVRLTITPFFVRAAAHALRAWPIVNASVEGEEVVYHRDINVGIAVALDWGLIVPVVRNADELSMAGLARRVTDLAERARAKKLNPDDVQGGTFTITNPGIYGGLYGLPIINQPQVAILGMGGIQKRPVVVDGDAIAVRSMMYMSMSYDHRVVDGATADQFLALLAHTLETFDVSQM